VKTRNGSSVTGNRRIESNGEEHIGALEPQQAKRSGVAARGAFIIDEEALAVSSGVTG